MRIDAELSEALDEFVEAAKVDRSTAVRMLLASGLKKGPTRALLLDVVATYQAQLRRMLTKVTAGLAADLPKTVAAELSRIEREVASELSGRAS